MFVSRVTEHSFLNFFLHLILGTGFLHVLVQYNLNAKRQIDA